MGDVRDFYVPIRPTWCTGCGNFGIWNALKQALAQLDLKPHQVAVISGIGCGSKLPDYTYVNGFMGLHGRTLPLATGVKMANHELVVICTHGDGDAYAEGLGHMMHAARRNIGIVDIVQDNRVYGLTKGQFSPTSERGRISKTSPWGSIELPVNPLLVALAAGATFVARSWSGDVDHLTWLITEAIKHRGYALIDVLQPCVTFNRAQAYDFYRPRVYKLEEDPHYDPTNLNLAFQKAQEWDDRIPIGIFYRTEERPAYEEMMPALAFGPLVKQPLGQFSEEQIQKLMAEFV
ncbi:MAG: thiamine pyrophosphate-dependent enzyme [Anaerolineae bacterium]|nr:thiamine pyrophosphate-dependent enzyme [Anaerolineae bacterium]MDW8102773.1 thiamine pyrophosphate-dependent enzyme [Anaerolineae bacterium]